MGGRDLLIGAVGGLSIVTLWHLTVLAPRWFGLPAAPLQMSTWALGEIRHAASYFAQSIAGALLEGIACVTLVLLFRAITRSDRAAVAIALAMLATTFINTGTGPLSFRLIYSLFAAAIVLTLLLRFGFLAVGSAFYFIWLLCNIPLTLDPSAWYFGRSVATILILAATATYGFFLSVRGKSFLPRLAFES